MSLSQPTVLAQEVDTWTHAPELAADEIEIGKEAPAAILHVYTLERITKSAV